MNDTQIRLKLFNLLNENPEMTQRQLAKALGVSLGKTNYLLNALLDKGWAKVANFRRSDHKMGYLYLLTPSGVGEKVRLTHDYLQRKEQEYELLTLELAQLRDELGLK